MNEVLKSFHRQPDGTWVCTRYTTFEGPTGRMQVTPGTAFARGTTFMGSDLAKWLDEQLATFGPRSEH